MSFRKILFCRRARRASLRALLTALTGAILLSACSQSASRPGGLTPRAESRILAVINQRPVTENSFEAFIRWRMEKRREQMEEIERAELFEEFVLENLLGQAAESTGIDVSPEEVAAEADKWFAREADADRLEELKRFLKIQKLIHRKVGSTIMVKTREVQEHYTQHASEYLAGERVHLFEILVDSRQEADETRSGLRAGDTRSFEEAAKSVSRGLTAESGGDLGQFERGQLPKEFERVVFDLKPGQISDVFRSGLGYHIFMVVEKVPQHYQKFFEVQEEIFDGLAARKEREALQAFMKQIVEGASIEIRDESLRAHWRRRYAEVSG